MTSATIRYSILALGFLSILGFTPAVLAKPAEPALTFHPVNAWTPGTIGALCTIHNTFNNGFVLGFSGQNENLDTLDINFQQDIFEEGKTYEASFRIPGQPALKFPATAAGANVLSVNLQSRNGLIGTLKKASAFDLNVESNDFRFYLTGFPAGVKSFEQCVETAAARQPNPTESSVSGIKQALIVPPNSKVPPTLNASADAKQEVAPEITITALLPEDTKPPMPLIPAVHAPVAAKTSTITWEQPPTTISENAAVEAEVQAQIDAAHAQAAAEEKNQPAPATPSAALQAPASSVMQISVLKPAPQKPGAQKRAAETAPGIAQNRTPGMIVRRERVDGGRVDLTPYADIEPSSATMDELPVPRILQKADPEMLRKISELESTIQKLKQENDGLNSDLSKNIRATEEERVSISSDNWNLERATMRFNESERESKRLAQQLQRERAQCAMEKQDIEAQLFDPQVTSQQQLARLAALEQKIAETQQQADDQRRRYEEQIRTLQGQGTETQ